jgi:putative NADH-flavin reductase
MTTPTQRVGTRLLVFGAAGRTGRLVVQQALADGHWVTAAVRSAGAMTLRHEQLTIVEADVLDAAATARSVAGHDAVISVIAPRRNEPQAYSRGIEHVIAGMRAAGVKRLVCTSAAPADPGMSLPWAQSLLMRWILRPMLRTVYQHARLMETALEASDLAWTVIRAPRLTNGPQTGEYRMAVRAHIHHALTISRADLAGCALGMLSNPATFRSWVEIAY